MTKYNPERRAWRGRSHRKEGENIRAAREKAERLEHEKALRRPLCEYPGSALHLQVVRDDGKLQDPVTEGPRGCDWAWGTQGLTYRCLPLRGDEGLDYSDDFELPLNARKMWA